MEKAEELFEFEKSYDTNNREEYWPIISFFYHPSFWVRELLLSRHLVDTESRAFVFWFRVYEAYVVISLLFLSYMTVATVVTQLVPTGVIATGWTRFFNL